MLSKIFLLIFPPLSPVYTSEKSSRIPVVSISLSTRFEGALLTTTRGIPKSFRSVNAEISRLFFFSYLFANSSTSEKSMLYFWAKLHLFIFPYRHRVISSLYSAPTISMKALTQASLLLIRVL